MNVSILKDDDYYAGHPNEFVADILHPLARRLGMSPLPNFAKELLDWAEVNGLDQIMDVSENLTDEERQGIVHRQLRKAGLEK